MRSFPLPSIRAPRRLLLGWAVLFGSACGGPASQLEDAEPPVIEASVHPLSTDQCAPAPAAQATNGSVRYYRYSTARTWQGAKADCEAMGGRLAVPNSSANNELIRSINGGSDHFIGVYQQSGQTSPGANWVTVSGAPLPYTNWNSGEPNDNDGNENGGQNCSRMYINSGKWDDVSCANTSSPYVCEFPEEPVACGGGATCAIPSGGSTYKCQCPAGQKFDARNNACYGGPLTIEVNSLNVDQAASGNVYVNFPIRARVGLKGAGNTNNLMVSLGLMEKPSGPNATQAELESLKSCMVGGSRVTLKGDGTQQYVDIDGIIQPECLQTSTLRHANFFVLLDGVEENTTEENKWLVFNEKEATTPLGQRCVTTDPATGQQRTGCVINVMVRPSPGLDIVLLTASPKSSVAVLDPPGQKSDVTAGQSEAARPLFTADVAVTAFGRDHDEANASTLPGQVDFAYSIIAQPDPANVGWKPLNANPEALHASISSLKPGEKLELDARLHPTPEFRTLTSPGGAWAAAQDFQVRACALIPFPEAGDPAAGGANGANNNCKTFSVRLVRGSFNSTSASSYDVSKTFSESWGSSSTLKLSLSGGSTNTLDLTGAYTDNDATATLGGFFGSVSLFKGWGNADATVSPAQATADVGFSIFGVELLSYDYSAGTLSYTKDLSYTKSKCLTYTYGVVVASIEISGCFSATAGLDTVLTLSATSISAQVRPYASATLTVSGTLNLTLYKATLSASITLLGLNTSDTDGVTTSLSFAINSLSPVKLTIAYNTQAVLAVSTLDGSIDFTVEQLEAGWCKKKKWGITFYYVCWDYDTLAEYNLFSYDGYSYSSTLLNRNGSAITLQ